MPSSCRLMQYRTHKAKVVRHQFNIVIISVKYSCKIRLQIKKLWAGHVFAAMSCCDIDLQGSDPNVVCDMASQYGNHFCEIVLKWDFK